MMARNPDAPATLADVARAAGVSTATASFVLSGRAGRSSSGSPATKQRVRAAAEELGYVPSRSAQAMRTGRGGGIVLSLGTLTDPWGVELASQVRAKALPHDLSTLVLADQRWFEYFSGAYPDCAFIAIAEPDDRSLERLHQLAATLNGGLVVFSTDVHTDEFDVISSSPVTAVQDAYHRLRSRHQRVCFLERASTDPGTRYPRGLRTRVFLRTADDHGDHPSHDLVRGHAPGILNAQRAAYEWLSDPERPRAVICSTAYQAVALHTAARQLGLRIPDDLEIISIGDVPQSSHMGGSISFYGVRDVFERIAAILVDTAVRRGPRTATRHDFTWEYFPGESTLD